MTDTTMAAADDGLEITELAEFDPTRLDGVKTAATGIPFLIMKAAAGDGNPEAPSAAEPEPAHQAWTGPHMHLHPAFGGPDKNGDGFHQHMHTHDGDNDHSHTHAGFDPDHDGDDDSTPAGDTDHDFWPPASKAAGNPGCGCCPDCTMAAKSADLDALYDEDIEKALLSAAERNNLPDSAFAYIEEGGKKDADGKTTPRSLRHFPIHDKAHADNAAARIAQGAKFGDQAKRKVLAAQRKFGSDTGDASKGATLAEGEVTVQDDAQGSDVLTKTVADAVTKATGPLKAEIETLRADLAKVKATPIPGGPVLSSAARPQGVAGDEAENWAAKAANYRMKADLATSPADREGYRQLARQADEKAQSLTT